MDKQSPYTIEEVAELLRVSKLTVYDLIKKGELSAYRVGRQMRIEQQDLETYKLGNKTIHNQSEPEISQHTIHLKNSQVVISGQDIVLDLLSKQIEPKLSETPLRLYTGSLNSLISMYNGVCDIVSLHLYDGETGQYNVPYAKRILVSQPFILINLVCRQAGIYVQKGNPHHIVSWTDLVKPQIQIVNREKGSGARVLLDEQLKLHNMTSNMVKGYNNELTNHLAIASAIANGQADAGIGIENVARMVNVDFIPLIKEQYDLVVLKTKENAELLNIVKEIVTSADFKSQLSQLNGYDLSLTGKVIYESF